MEISIELFPAGNGDAILLDTGTHLILIDCGYVSTFRDHVKPRLQELSQAGRTLTKLIVTHIDADHIQGAITFIEENGNADDPSIIKVDEIWFNSYRHLYFSDKEQGGFNGAAPNVNIPQGQASVEADDTMRLVSFSQGTSLGRLVLEHGYAWNTTFNGNAVAVNGPVRFDLGPDTSITLLGPTQEALETLGNRWYKYLRKLFKGKINEDTFFDDAFEMMMEEMRQAELDAAEAPDEEALVSTYFDWVEAKAVDWIKEDTSPTNGSSIVFMIEHKQKKLLFLADAIPTPVITQLKKLYTDDDFPIHVNALKVAHHGAWPNNSPELLKMVYADYFLFSSNGSRHSHPHLQTLAWILKEHQEHQPKTFVFNYRQTRKYDEIEDPNIKAAYKYETLWPDVDEFGNGDNGYVKLHI